MTAAPGESHESSFFVSYAREDLAFRARLGEAMLARGRRFWIDEDIPTLASWRDEVRAAIVAADVFLFVLSPDSLVSGPCLEELSIARSCAKRIAPVVCRAVEGLAIPDGLGEPNWVFLRDTDDFDGSLTRLLAAADTDVAWVKTHTRIAVRARDWSEHDRDESLLLRGRDLETALAWLARSAGGRAGDVGDGQIEFLEAARMHEAEQNARLREQYDRAVARQLAFRSELERGSSPGSLRISALLAAESIGLSRTSEGDLALRRAMAQLPPGARRTLHHDGGRVLALSPDGRVLAVATGAGIELWDVGSDGPHHTLPAGPVGSLALDEQGTRLLSLDDRHHARLWHAGDGTPIHEFDVGSAPALVALCPDTAVVAVASAGSIRVWDGAGSAPAHELDAGADVRAMALADGGLILVAVASGPTDGALHAWDLTGERTFEPVDLGGTVRHAEFGAGGAYLAVMAVHVGPWMGPNRDVTDVTVLALSEEGMPRTELRHHDPIRAFGFTGDRGFVHTVTDRTVGIWRADNGQPVGSVAVDAEPLHVALEADTMPLATAQADGTVRVTDLVAGTQIMALDRRARAIAFDTGGSLVVAGQDRTETWRVAAGFELLTARPGAGRHLPGGDPAATAAPARFSLAGLNATVHGFSPDGGTVLVAGPGGLLTFLDTRSRDVRVLTTPPHSGRAFTADGEHLVTVSARAAYSSGGDHGDCHVRVWHTGTGELVHEYDRPCSPFFDIDEPGGRLAHASTEGDEVWVRDSASGEQTHHLRFAGPVTGLRFSAGGSHLAVMTGEARLEVVDLSTDRITFRGEIDAPYVTALDAGARYAVVPRSTSAPGRGHALCDLRRGGYVALPSGDRVVSRLAIAPDAGLAAVAYEQGGFRVCALPSARELLATPTRHVIGMALLGTGHVATVEVDDTLHVFGLADGVDVMPPLAHPDETRNPVVDRAGRLIATGCNDGWVRVWAWQVADLVAEAHARVGRGLTDEERAHFLPDDGG